jgi:hypothetical protein
MAQEPISNIRNRLRDWLSYASTGSNVEDLDLDLLNRANRYLEDLRRWDFLRRVYAMTLTATTDGQVCTLPSYITVIESIYTDSSGIGKPDCFFYENDTDVSRRYTKEYVYDKNIGGYWVITFPSMSSLLSNPKLIYKTTLDDFEGIEGADEYAIWPSDLLIRCAQKIHVEEAGSRGFDVEGILKAYEDSLRIFETKMQYNNQRPDFVPKYSNGQPMKITNMGLNGSVRHSGQYPYPPSAFFHG